VINIIEAFALRCLLILAPAQLFIACSTKKQGGPGNFSHVSDVRVEKAGKNGTLGLRAARRAKVPGNLPHVSSQWRANVINAKC